MEDRDVYYNFLEALRKSGVTNMFGATPYLEAEFEELTHAEAMEILKDWMANYSELSKRLGWDKSMTPSESGSEEEDVVIEDDEDYYNLFHEDVSKDIINPFLKQLAEEDKMDELNNADHIWDTEFPFFVVLYKDGNVKFINQSDEIVVYDNIEEICSDFGIDLDEAVSAIKDLANIDVSPKYEEPEEDELDVEPVEYGSDEVIEDEFEFEEEGE